MATDPTGYAGPHPDLRDQICDMANMLAEQSRDRYDWPSRPFTREDMTILGQRTWNGITTINHVIHGGGVSAILVTSTVEGKQYGGLVMAGCKPDSESWGLMSAGFGEASAEHGVRGDMTGSGYHCIGFHGSTAGYLQNLYAVEIEYADGTIHRAQREDDDCTIVFAPVERWDRKDNDEVIRFLDVDGAVVHSESRYLGAGMGPPDGAS